MMHVSSLHSTPHSKCCPREALLRKVQPVPTSASSCVSRRVSPWQSTPKKQRERKKAYLGHASEGLIHGHLFLAMARPTVLKESVLGHMRQLGSKERDMGLGPGTSYTLFLVVTCSLQQGFTSWSFHSCSIMPSAGTKHSAHGPWGVFSVQIETHCPTHKSCRVNVLLSQQGVVEIIVP